MDFQSLGRVLLVIGVVILVLGNLLLLLGRGDFPGTIRIEGQGFSCATTDPRLDHPEHCADGGDAPRRALD